jgi:hypothetical protein
MILSDLLGAEVHFPKQAAGATPAGVAPHTDRIGWVTDVRLLLDQVGTDQAMPRARVYGLVISPHTKSSSLGFERLDIRSPWPIARYEHWSHRESFLVLWRDVAGIAEQRVTLRPGFTHYSSVLTSSAVRRPGD